MRKITILTNRARQNFKFKLDDNMIEFYFEYKEQQLGWFISFKYQDYEFNNLRLVNSPNMLRSYRNYLPFGLAVQTNDGLEPLQKDDLVNGYATVYVLNKDDIIEVENIYYARN